MSARSIRSNRSALSNRSNLSRGGFQRSNQKAMQVYGNVRKATVGKSCNVRQRIRPPSSSSFNSDFNQQCIKRGSSTKQFGSNTNKIINNTYYDGKPKKQSLFQLSQQRNKTMTNQPTNNRSSYNDNI